MTNPLWYRAVGLMALAALAGCGGQSEGDTASSPFSADTSFRAYAKAYVPANGNNAGATASSTPLTAAETAEVAELSRDWAVAALDGGSISTTINAMTLPSLHFARQSAVAAAAHGDTLAQLKQQARLPSGEGVAAGLAQGVKRSISALADGHFKPAFMSVAAAENHPGTWASLSLQPLSASQLATDVNRRMVIEDDAGLQAAWPQATAARGLFQWGGDLYDVPALRVQGPVLQRTGATYTAAGLALASGGWLIQITPNTHSTEWLGPALKAALADVATAIAARPGSEAVTGELLLPLIALNAPESRGEGAGMSLALDPVNADLRGLDAGGTYLKAADVRGGLDLSAAGLNLSGSLSTAFVFSPLNIYGGGTYGSVFTRGDGDGTFSIFPLTWPACPANATPLRPFYLVLMQSNGSISLLARMARFTGTRCQ